MLVRAEAEVLDGLAGVLGAAEQEGVGASGLLEGQLVEGKDLAAGREDASTGGGGDAESGNRHLGDGQEAVVIGDGADDDNSLVLVALLEVPRDTGQRDGGAVDAAHEEAAQDHLVEGRIGATCGHAVSTVASSKDRFHAAKVLTSQEAVKLHQELQVDIVALGSLAVRGPLVVPLQIDTYCSERTPVSL